MAGLLWPALVNRSPIWFYDTEAYLGKAGQALDLVFGSDSGAAAAASSVKDTGRAEDSATVSGRSIYYGLAVVLFDLGFGAYGGVVLQALLCAAVLTTVLAPYFRSPAAGVLFTGAAVVALSAAPFFASYVMPDLFAGLAILTVAHLLTVPTPPRPAALAVWGALLAFFLASHLSHVIVAAGMLAIASLVLPLAGLRWPWRRGALVLAAIVLALGLEVLFGQVVTRVYGQAPIRPPFLSARLIDDGPGYRLLQQTCPGSGYELCRYIDRMPAYSDDFLWSRDPAKGVFALADPAAQRRLSEEQFGFATAVLRRYPLAVAESSGKRLWEQLSHFSLQEFPYPSHMIRKIDALPEAPQRRRLQSSRLYLQDWDLTGISRITQAAALVSLGLVAVFAIYRPRRAAGAEPAHGRHFAAFAALILLGVLGNAAATGILSTPHDRYQARVIWLLPMLAAALVWRRYLDPLHLRGGRMVPVPAYRLPEPPP